MKRTIILIVILLGLLGLWWYSSNKEETKMEVLTEERRFHVNKIGKIEEIKLSYGDREDVRLEKVDDRWIANDSLEIWGPTVQTLLATLRDMRVEYTAPKASTEKIKKDIEDFGIEVTAIDGNGDELTGFSLGGVTPGEDGTFAIKKGFDQAFVVGIPYQEGTIRNRFVLDEEEWKNRWIFREPLEKIQKVSVDYPMFPDRSFVLERQGPEDYVISRIEGEKKTSETVPVAQGMAEGYLMQFEEIGIEAYENTNKKQDSIRSLQPLATITVQTGNQETWIKLYPIDHTIGEVNLSEEYLTKGQLFRFFGDYSSGDFVLIQFFTIGDALKKYSDFVD